MVPPFSVSMLLRPGIGLQLGDLFMSIPTRERRKRTQRDYSLGFKLLVVSSVERGDMSYKQAQSLYGIQGRSTVLTWLRKHGKLDWSNPSRITMPHSVKAQETPAQKIKRLEKELEDERLRNLLLNEVVDILDAKYGAGLRKKLAARERDACRPKAK